MTLNLPLLYWFWLVEYCQTSPNKNKSPNLWQVTNILVCCIFAQTPWFKQQVFKCSNSTLWLENSILNTKKMLNIDNKKFESTFLSFESYKPEGYNGTSTLLKGQTISEWIYEVIVSPKIQTKNCQDFCPV